MYQNPPLVDFSLAIFKGNFLPLCMIFSGDSMRRVILDRCHVFRFFKIHYNLCCDCRHDDLKAMLDSSKDNLKLDAMKRIVGVG